MESIMDGTRTLIRQVVDSLKTDVVAVQSADCDKSKVEEIFESNSDPFSGIDSETLLSKYVKENFHYVEQKEVKLGTKLLRSNRGGKRIICEKDETFIYIPILKSLQQLLSNKRIASMVLEKPKCCHPGVYYDIHDGKIYKDDDYFDNHENTMSLILYHDELEVANPLGSRAGVHKLDMYYYSMGNISPKFRSKRCAVRLFAIANADLVKKYGIDCIMKPLVDDLQLLYEGYTFEVGGIEKVIHGKVLMCNGDTLGQHYWGGYKEGVGAAFSKCRHCQCAFEQMQQEFRYVVYVTFCAYQWLRSIN